VPKNRLPCPPTPRMARAMRSGSAKRGQSSPRGLRGPGWAERGGPLGRLTADHMQHMLWGTSCTQAGVGPPQRYTGCWPSECRPRSVPAPGRSGRRCTAYTPTGSTSPAGAGRAISECRPRRAPRFGWCEDALLGLAQGRAQGFAQGVLFVGARQHHLGPWPCSEATRVKRA
jgi:hypothetical protein